MSRVDNLTKGELSELVSRISRLEMATPLSNTSVGRGRLRMYDGSELLIEGGNLKVSGIATVDGQLVITGTLNGSGTLTWTGTSNLDGPVIIDGVTTINGATTVNGTMSIKGLTTLDNNLVLGTGTIKAGSVTIDKLGTASGRIWSSGQMVVDGTSIFLGASTTVSGPLGCGNLGVSGDLTVSGNQTVTGTKSFRMDHPTKPGWWIQHGSTESPISGTEYTGTEKFDSVGKCIVTLPAYFEALNKTGNRTAHITAVGQPFMVGADRVVAGKFTAYGTAGRDFDWIVKGERIGGDFAAESKKPVEP